MKKYLLAVAGLALCCGLSATAAARQKNSSGCGTDVTSLRVTILDEPGNGLLSDGKGDYVSMKSKGEQIDAKFQISNCTFDFTTNLFYSSRFMTYLFPGGSPLGDSARFTFFNMDRVASIPVTDGGADFQNWCNAGVVTDSAGKVVPNATTGYYQDNYALCGKDLDTYDAAGGLVSRGRDFVRRAYGSTLSDDSYRVRFNYSPLDSVTGISIAAGTAYVKVYASVDPAGPQVKNAKGKLLPNTWEVIPEHVLHPKNGNDSGPWSILMHYPSGVGGVVNEGYYKRPFRMVVKRQ